jgi:hypothetical protein
MTGGQAGTTAGVGGGAGRALPNLKRQRPDEDDLQAQFAEATGTPLANGTGGVRTAVADAITSDADSR